MVKVIFHPDCFKHGISFGNLLETSQAEASAFGILRTWALDLESHFRWKQEWIYKIHEELMPDTEERTQQGAADSESRELNSGPSSLIKIMFACSTLVCFRDEDHIARGRSVSWDGLVTCPWSPSWPTSEPAAVLTDYDLMELGPEHCYNHTYCTYIISPSSAGVTSSRCATDPALMKWNETKHTT